MTLTTWRSSFDHPDPHGIQLNALKDMTLGYNFGYIWQILSVWSRLRARFDMLIPRILGLRDGSREPHYDIIAHFRSQLCRPVSIQVMIYDRYDRYDGWNETKWCSKQFFNHFAWLLFEFLQRKDNCGTSWCFFVRSWRLSPKATSGSTFLAFLRSVESWPWGCMHRRCRILHYIGEYHLKPLFGLIHWNRRNRFLFVEDLFMRKNLLSFAEGMLLCRIR